MWPIEVIHQSDDAVYFVGVGDNDIPANELEAPAHDYLQSEAKIDEIHKEIISLKADLAKKDKVHFTKEGYQLLGDLLYNALITKYIEHIQLNAKRNDI